jgi:predicted nucleic acid-binding protein
VIAERATLEISSIAWYEFCRGPRTPDQLALARDVFGDAGILPFREELAEIAADVFRRARGARRRVADIAIGVVARERGARLLSRNAKDFSGIEGLEVEALGLQ